MRIHTALLGSVLLAATVASAQNVDVIKARQTLYKGMGNATKAPGEMLKGSAPYDAKAVMAALDTYIDASKKLPNLFPDDAKTGNDTQALPEIWAHKDDFIPRFAKFGRDAEAAKTSITDEASFRTEFPKVVANCAACHKEYRAKT